MHSYVAFLMYPDIRRYALEELVPENLNYIKEEFKEKRTLAKNAGFAIKPFYLILTFLYKDSVVCLSRKLNNFVALYGNIEV